MIKKRERGRCFGSFVERFNNVNKLFCTPTLKLTWTIEAFHLTFCVCAFQLRLWHFAAVTAFIHNCQSYRLRLIHSCNIFNGAWSNTLQYWRAIKWTDRVLEQLRTNINVSMHTIPTLQSPLSQHQFDASAFIY